mgnify:CR=1 FL=1
MSGGNFWSRRQAAVAAEAEAEEQAVLAAQSAVREAELAEQSDEEILAALDLPAPESLAEGDDFKVFLTDQIPARIKTRALRHLWRANPVLACVDGLVDYGEDFTDAACVIEGLQTAYQVGKGMTQHVEALAQEAEAERLAAQATSDPEPQILPVEDTAPQGEIESVISTQETASTPAPEPELALAAAQAGQADPSADAVPLAETQITAAPRRMRFSFDGAAV